MKKLLMILMAVAMMTMAGCGGGGSSSSVPLSSAKSITLYYLAGFVGTINETAKTINVTMPYGTDVTQLVAMFRKSAGANVKVGTTAQVSETTANNFTNPVIYTVTAANGTTQNYTVTVTVAAAKPKAFLTYSLAGVAGIINETGKIIYITLPAGTNLANLVATFTATGTSVTVNGTPQTSGVTPNNFTNPVVYTVTAANNATQNYTIKINAYMNVKKELDYTNDGKMDEVHYFSYYTDLRRAKEEVDDNNDDLIDAMIIQGYDANLNNTRVEYDTNNDGLIDHIYYHTYNANDQRTKTEVDQFNDGTIDHVYRFTYDANGNKIKEEHYIGSQTTGNADDVTYYTYDANGNMTKMENDYGNDGKSDYIEYYTYTGGNKTKMEIDSDGNGVINQIVTYTYNAGDQLTQVGYDLDCNGTTDNLIKYSYDAHGNQRKEEFDYGNDTIIEKANYTTWQAI